MMTACSNTNDLLRPCFKYQTTYQKKSDNTRIIGLFDDFDPYLVVAADKGTATFQILRMKCRFNGNSGLRWICLWGQHGYDHKKVGITAKGPGNAPNYISNPFKNPETDSIKVVAIGDMAGDVFGNGMLLSKSIHLIAAFNHQHIMFDPSPNATASWKERARLFSMSGSNWLDYKQISPGVAFLIVKRRKSSAQRKCNNCLISLQP